MAKQNCTHLSQSTQFPAHLQILHLGIGPEASPASSQPHFSTTLSMGWKMPCSHSRQNFCFRESRVPSLCRWRKPENCKTLASALSGQGCSLGNLETAKSVYAWSCFPWTHKQSKLPWCTVSGDAVPGCVRSLQCFPHLHLHVSKDLHFLHERSACLQSHHHQEERERKRKHFQKKKMTAIRVTSRKYDIDIWYLKYQKLAARGTLVTAQFHPHSPYCTRGILLSSLVWRWIHSLTPHLSLIKYQSVSYTVGSDRGWLQIAPGQTGFHSKFQSAAWPRVNRWVKRKGREKTEKEGEERERERRWDGRTRKGKGRVTCAFLAGNRITL